MTKSLDQLVVNKDESTISGMKKLDANKQKILFFKLRNNLM